MSYTKGQIVKEALTELGIAGYGFDVDPEQLEVGIRRLDSLIARWSANGLRLPYPISSDAKGSTADQETNLPDVAIDAVTLNLALSLAPSYGKTPSMETKNNAKEALTTLQNKAAMPRARQLEQMPKGAAYKNYDYPYFPNPERRNVVDVDERVDLSGGPDGM
jgi:hypothetical protein